MNPKVEKLIIESENNAQRGESGSELRHIRAAIRELNASMPSPVAMLHHAAKGGAPERLKPCPFCGSGALPSPDNYTAKCSNASCPLNLYWLDRDFWQRRWGFVT